VFCVFVTKATHNILVKRCNFVFDAILQPKKYVYDVFRLSQKAAVNFCKPAISMKKIGLVLSLAFDA